MDVSPIVSPVLAVPISVHSYVPFIVDSEGLIPLMSSFPFDFSYFPQQSQGSVLSTQAMAHNCFVTL